MKIPFHFTATPFQHKDVGWFLVSLPVDMSEEIRNAFKSDEEGWGRLKASAKIGNTEWQTALWYAVKTKCYLLPIKSEIRKKERLDMTQPLNIVVLI